MGGESRSRVRTTGGNAEVSAEADEEGAGTAKNGEGDEGGARERGAAAKVPEPTLQLRAQAAEPAKDPADAENSAASSGSSDTPEPADAAAKPKPKPESDAGTGAAARPKPKPKPPSKAAKKSPSTPRPTSKSPSKRPSRPKPSAAPKPGAKPEPDTSPKADTPTESPARPKPGSAPKPEAEAEAEAKGDSPTTVLGRPKSGPEPESAVEPDAAEPDPEGGSKPESKASPKGDSPTTVLGRPSSAAEPESEGEAKPQAEAAPKGDRPTTVLGRPSTRADSPSASGAIPDADAAKSDASASESAERVSSETPTDAKPEADSGGDTETAPGAKPKADSAAEADAKSESATPSGATPSGATATGAADADAPPKPSTPPKPSAPPKAPKPPTSGASPAPPAPPAAPPLKSPETTSEAMQVLASLSGRRMTPMRQVLRRVKIWGTLVALLLVVFTIVQLVRPLPDPAFKLTAASSYSFSGTAPAMPWPSAGQSTVEVEGLGSLGRSGPEGTAVPIASVTKVMTAYLILRDHPLKSGAKGPTITVDAQAAHDFSSGSAQGESVVKVTDGQKISEYQALQMLLIPSANNIARLLGRWDAGSDAAFVQKMQSTAKKLGMDATTYTDPSGLTPTTKSTADDQLKLAREVWQEPVFQEIVGTGEFTPPGDGVMYNNNAMLGQDGIVGMKTGSSSAALGCLMFAAEYKVGGQTKTVLGVTLGQPATSSASILTNALNASKDLVVAAEKSLQSHDLVKKGEVVGYVDDDMGGHTPVVATKDSTVDGWSGLSVQLGLAPSASDGKVPHTAKAGQQVGYLTIGSGAGQTKIPVAVQSDLKEPSMGARWAHI